MNAQQQVTLRQTKDQSGSYYLYATLNPNGDVVIGGQDLGKGVEEFWGEGLTEYEFTMKIQAADVPLLLQALEAQDNVLGALEQRFQSQADIQPGSFLDEYHIPYEFWSRVGD
jgi:hypothetical protein